MSWAEDHLDSNETATMHEPAAIDELHIYCEDCEKDFEEPQESPYCDCCKAEREVKALRIQIGELEGQLKEHKRFVNVLVGVNEKNKKATPNNIYEEGIWKGLEIHVGLARSMNLI